MAGRVAPYVDNTGLVFAYDQFNTVRSYLGQPATNVITSGIPGYFGSGGETLYQESLYGLRSDSGVFQRNFVTNPALADSGTYNNNGGLYKNFSTSTLSSSTRYIQISFDFYMITRYRTFASSTTGLNGYIGITYADSTTGDHGWNTTYSNGSGDDWSNDAAYVGRWQKVSLIAALNDKSPSSINAMYIYADRLTQGEGVFTNFIITEHATFPTGPVRYTAGTRSATQGLKDLTGRSTIDLSNVSFDSSAQMTFDGTDDFIPLGNLGTIGSAYTLECVFNSTSASSYRNVFDMNYNTYSGVTGNTGPRLEQTTGQGINFIWSGVTNSNNLYNYTNTISISANRNYHVAFVQDGSTGKMYLDGTLRDSANNTQGYLQTFGDAAIGRGFTLDPSRYFSGGVYIFKIYNRALTASEIQQNFNAVRGRYGI